MIRRLTILATSSLHVYPGQLGFSPLSSRQSGRQGEMFPCPMTAETWQQPVALISDLRQAQRQPGWHPVKSEAVDTMVIFSTEVGQMYSTGSRSSLPQSQAWRRYSLGISFCTWTDWQSMSWSGKWYLLLPWFPGSKMLFWNPEWVHGTLFLISFPVDEDWKTAREGRKQ